MADHVSVASSVYSLAGGERPDFLKSLIFGGVLKDAPLGSVIPGAYKNGPRVKLRNYMRWAKTDPDFTTKIGLPWTRLDGYLEVDHETVRANIPPDTGQSVDKVEIALVGEADVSYWVLQYLCQAHPDDDFGIDSSYSFEFNKDKNVVTITFADSHTEAFTVSGFAADGWYLYARYVPALPEVFGPTAWDLLYTTLPEGTDFQDTSGYLVDSQHMTAFTANLGYRQKRVTTASDGRAPVEVISATSKSNTIAQLNTVYFQDNFKGQGPGAADSVYSERHWLETDLTYFVSDWIPDDQVHVSHETVGGVTFTYTTTGEFQTFLPIRKTKNGSSEVVHKEWLPPQYFIYQLGTGNAALDALFSGTEDVLPDDTFYPPIPFRYNNKAVGPEGTGAIQWEINVGAFLNINKQTLQVYGGPVAEVDAIELDIGSMGSNPFSYFVQSKPGYLGDLGQVVQAGNCKFRIISDASLPTVSGQTEFTDWMPLLAPPVPHFPPTDDPDRTPEEDAAFDAAEAVERATAAAIYPTCKTAFRKATGARFGDVQDTILNNPKIRDIDHVLTTFGVALNTTDNASRRYLYKFFSYLNTIAPGFSAADEAQWYLDWQASRDSELVYNLWKVTQTVGLGNVFQVPATAPYRAIPWQTLKIASVLDGVSNYRIDLKWAFITEELAQPGQFKSGVVKDDCEVWIIADPVAEYREVDADNPDGFNQRIAILWQDTDTTFRKLTITGLQHVNHVYKGMKITTTAKQALEATGADSPFIVPLHEATYDSMSMVDGTQMGISCAYLVFNCYEVKKEQWYETTAFKVILIVAIIGVSIALALVSGGTSLGAGGALVVGVLTGAGLSTVAAIVITAIAEVLVAMLISFLIDKGSVALFGEKWGHLIGMILSTVLFLGVGAAGSGASLTDVLSSPSTWMSLGMATGSGVATVLEASAKEIAEGTAKELAKISEQAAEVQRRYDEEFGSKKIDASLINKYISDLTERPEEFLQRTLMTGSDIVELTLRAVSSFAEDRLRLER